MNLNTFTLWLSGFYLFYYGFIIFWDFFRNRRYPEDVSAYELSFEEYMAPRKEFIEEPPVPSESAVHSSGGVSLKQLFNLAREEAIEFTRPVSF